MKIEQNGCAILPLAKDFKFCLGQLVSLRISEEFGEVQARSQSLNGENQYFVHYQAADKCATERWYNESQLVAVEDERSPGMPVFGCVELSGSEIARNKMPMDVDSDKPLLTTAAIKKGEIKLPQPCQQVEG
ncbi:TPA: hypothetical protein ACTYRS_003509 [Klebsiella pneumoniae]|nr:MULTISPECIES: hypothetical protein [Klebsiella/Raoultella group]MDM7296285.1 hypothetical protein [Klebsiella pneumoniae]SVW41518.1 Uncharacterised protein [Klebsiella pneumoniae]